MRKLLIIVSAIALVVAFALPAAADVSFYGNVRMSTGFTSVSKEATATGLDDSDLDWALDNGSSRFGANFKDGDVGANVEIRPNNGSYYRHWYGWWQAGFGKLIVGQTWTPTFNPYTDDVYKGGPSPGYGMPIGSVRQPQIALYTGSLKLALREPSSSAVAGGNEQDVTMPAIEASYKLTAGPAGITLWFGYNSFDDIVVAGTTETSYGITSYMLGGTGSFSFGAAYLNVNIWTGQNCAEGGFYSGAPAVVISGTTVKDVTTMAYGAAFGYKISPTMKICAGYLATTSEVDVPGSKEDTNACTYVNLPITLAKGVSITPEIDLLDHGDDTAGNDEGSTTQYGVYWMISF